MSNNVEDLGPVSAFQSLCETLEETNKDLLLTLQRLRDEHEGQKGESYLYSTMPFAFRTDRILEVTDQVQKNLLALVNKAKDVIEFVKQSGEVRE